MQKNRVVDLDDAAKQALRDMIKWLVASRGWTSEEAYVFCSLACDLHVTQLVDGNKGVHAMILKSIFTGSLAVGRTVRRLREPGTVA